MTRVKICGIATLEDASIALGYGADALGFLVGLHYETPDRLTADRARYLVSELPPFVTSVLVTHLTDLADVRDLCARVGVSSVQLHGDFPIRDIPNLRSALPHLKIIKAVHSDDRESYEAAMKASYAADAILLDTRVGERIGGTGKTHDWDRSRRIREALEGFPVILAGGLGPDNVESAIERVQPFGVDVNTGVQGKPGRKDPDRVRRFIARAKQLRTEPGQRESVSLEQTG
ncbi:MAG: phosphoribosylanthranilate isomerase [Acidobacteriota bacterium]